MPQMMPLNWINLFIWFILVFMMFNILNFYLFNQHQPTISQNLATKINALNWKW